MFLKTNPQLKQDFCFVSPQLKCNNKIKYNISSIFKTSIQNIIIGTFFNTNFQQSLLILSLPQMLAEHIFVSSKKRKDLTSATMQ